LIPTVGTQCLRCTTWSWISIDAKSYAIRRTGLLIFFFQFYISLYIDQTEDRFLENIGNCSFTDIMKDS
jgi:hypothetical protein